ncbi:hypothetical protein J6590_031606 [Homalodisca vitripennis]|nr:hypothetical protein J6590_031606 [Homalodisca vitripennis]
MCYQQNISVVVYESAGKSKPEPSEVRVQWDPPDQMSGILNNYTVVLQNRTLRYKVAPGCQLPTLQPLQVVVNGTTMTAVITELPADMQFQVTVVAKTMNGGSGPPSTPVTSETLSGGELTFRSQNEQ